MTKKLVKNLNEAAPVLKEFVGKDNIDCALILGSGLGDFAASLEDSRKLPFENIPHMKSSTVPGHKGRFVLGSVPTGQRVLCMQGRLHVYEGYSPVDVAFPIWLMSRVGVKVLITTNAAGAINPNFSVGEFCIMDDYINLTGGNPLVGLEPNKIANRFVPMNDAFAPRLRKLALEAGKEHDIATQHGTYLALLGPSFETPAEIRAFAALGADTVAMSVAEEVIAARHSGMEVLGVSLISNMAAGIEGAVPTIEEIDDIGKAGSDTTTLFLQSIIAKL